MMFRALRSLLAAALFLGTPPALANDFGVGGSGADLVPLQETRIRMKSERIQITFRDGFFDVAADYVFENTTPEAIRVQVGFPEILCPDDVDCDARFWELRTLVDGAEVSHRQGKLERTHEWSKHLGTVWLFDVTFAGNAQTQIRHTYRTTPGGSVDRDKTFSYVTRTGATWAGNIGQATFTVKLPPEVHTVSNTMGRPTLIQPKHGAPYVELRVEHHDWDPKDDLQLGFHYAPLFPPALGADRFTRSGVKAEDECVDVGEPGTLAQLQMCKNLVYAISGFPFTRPELRKYFYGGPQGFRLAPSLYAELDPKAPRVWVRGLQELPSHDAAQMPEPNRQFLRRLDEIAAKGIEPLATGSIAVEQKLPPVSALPSAAPPVVSSKATLAAPEEATVTSATPGTPTQGDKAGCSLLGLEGRSASSVGWVLLAGLALLRRQTRGRFTRGFPSAAAVE